MTVEMVKPDDLTVEQRLTRIENMLENILVTSADGASVAEEVRQMVHLLGVIQEEVGPVIASLQDVPMLKMFLGKGGK